MSKQTRFFVAICSLTTAIWACGQANPQYYGGFVRQGGSLVEMADLTGQEWDLSNPPSMPDINDSKPVFVLWQQQTDIGNVALKSIFTREIFDFKATPLKDGAIEIVPVQALEPGVYCLIQGDITLAAAELPTWCVSVQGGLDAMVAENNNAMATAQAMQETAVAQDAATQQAQERATAEAIAQEAAFWSGTDGQQIMGLVADAQRLIYQAVKADDPGILDGVLTDDYESGNHPVSGFSFAVSDFLAQAPCGKGDSYYGSIERVQSFELLSKVGGPSQGHASTNVVFVFVEEKAKGATRFSCNNGSIFEEEVPRVDILWGDFCYILTDNSGRWLVWRRQSGGDEFDCAYMAQATVP